MRAAVKQLRRWFATVRCREPCQKQALPYHHTAVYGTQPVKAVHGWGSRPPARGNVKRAQSEIRWSRRRRGSHSPPVGEESARTSLARDESHCSKKPPVRHWGLGGSITPAEGRPEIGGEWREMNMPDDIAQTLVRTPFWSVALIAIPSSGKSQIRTRPVI